MTIDKLREHRLVPVAIVENVDDGLRLAEALLNANLPVIEITFRTKAASEVIAAVAREYPDIVLGAGTLLNTTDLDRAFDAGARFGVSPGCNPSVIRQALRRGMPFFPGVASPSDIERGLELGLRTFKFFPAEAAGGVTMLKALIAPYRHLGVQFCPTGGITEANCTDYLALPEVACVGGSWMASSTDINDHNWDAITTAAQNALASATMATQSRKV